MISTNRYFAFVFLLLGINNLPFSVSAQPAGEAFIVHVQSGNPALDGFLTQAVPDWMTISELRITEFPNGNAGGRVSIAGSFITTQNVVAPADGYGGLRSALINKGFTIPGVIDAGVALTVGRFTSTSQPIFREFYITIAAGAEISFSGELPYIETVDGKSFSGSLNYSLPRNLQSQVVEQDMQPNGYVVDGLKFEEVVSLATKNVVEMEHYLNNEGMAPFFDGLFRYDLPMLATFYGRPTIDFRFSGNPMTNLAQRVRYEPPSVFAFGPLPARMEIDFDLEGAAFDGAERQYQTLAQDLNNSWHLTLVMPIEDPRSENVSVQVRFSSQTQSTTKFTEPMVWNGQYFEHYQWEFYAHE